MVRRIVLLGLLASGISQGAQQANPSGAAEPRPRHEADLIYRAGSSSDTKCPLVVRAKPLRNLWVLSKRCFAEASSTPPVIAQLGDAKFYVLASELHYKLGIQREEMTVPKGFITDLTSIPRPLWSVLPRDGQYMSAAILHDYMYWDQRCTKDEADTILKLQMAEFGVPKNVANDVYQGVHLAGSSAWNSNAKARLKSLRIMPEPYLDKFLQSEFNASQSWDELQKEMLAEGVKPTLDKGNPTAAAICRRVAGL